MKCNSLKDIATIGSGVQLMLTEHGNICLPASITTELRDMGLGRLLSGVEYK